MYLNLVYAIILKAGYPVNYFSFHSFRAGYIQSALLQSDTNILEKVCRLKVSVLTCNKIAFIACWIPNGSAQRKYIKSTMKQSLVANKVADASFKNVRWFAFS